MAGDLLILDDNSDTISQWVPPNQLRLVTKSLPSIPLLDHVMKRTGQRKLMLFSLCGLWDMLSAFGDSCDYLWGLPLT